MSDHVYTYTALLPSGARKPIITQVPLHAGDHITIGKDEYRVKYVLHAQVQSVEPIAILEDIT